MTLHIELKLMVASGGKAGAEGGVTAGGTGFNEGDGSESIRVHLQVVDTHNSGGGGGSGGNAPDVTDTSATGGASGCRHMQVQ